MAENYSQRDARWAGQRLGVCDGVTIGSDGCFVTAFANIASHFGKDVTPGSLDDIFTGDGSSTIMYANGCLCTDDMLTRVYPDIQYVETFHFENAPADFSVLVNTFQDEYVVEIDANPSAPGVQTHFMRFYDYYNGVLRVIDSWTGNLINVADVYGDAATAVQKFVHYVGPTPTPSTPPPPIPVVDPAPVIPDPHVATPEPAPEQAPAPLEGDPVPITITPVEPSPEPPSESTASTTPIKPGIKTSEFKVTSLVGVLPIVLPIINSYFHSAFTLDQASQALQLWGTYATELLAIFGAAWAVVTYIDGRVKLKMKGGN